MGGLEGTRGQTPSHRAGKVVLQSVTGPETLSIGFAFQHIQDVMHVLGKPRIADPLTDQVSDRGR